MKNDLDFDDLVKIKKRYERKVLDGLCWIQNDLNYSSFRYYLKDLDLEKQFEISKKKIEDNYKVNLDIVKYNQSKQMLEKIVEDYTTTKNDAKTTFEYSDGLIKQVEEDYKKNDSQCDALTIYRNVCKEIMDNAVRVYIKCEKSLVLIIDKLKHINN